MLQAFHSNLFLQAKEAVLAADWPTLEVHPLQENQKLEIVTGYMEGIYGKTLAAGLKDMIIQAPQTNNPLYLKALLDEVRACHYGKTRAQLLSRPL